MKRKSSDPTLSQVAAMAGVSIATASRVLNDPTKVRPSTVEKVSAAIDALSYPRPQPVADLRNRLIVARSSRESRSPSRDPGWRCCSTPRAMWKPMRAGC